MPKTGPRGHGKNTDIASGDELLVSFQLHGSCAVVESA